MKLKKLSLLAFAVSLLAGCQVNKPETRLKAATAARALLQDTVGWKTDTLSPGLIQYTYSQYYRPFASAQLVHVLEVDLASGRYDLALAYVEPGDSLSAVAGAKEHALAGINGTYHEKLENGLSTSFLKTGHQLSTSVTIPPTHKLFWKHEGAFYFDGGKKKMGIAYGNNATYHQMPYAHIISGSPMLIYNFKPVGENFAKPQPQALEQLDYEHPDRHQGVRHPRTAIAVVDKARVLLITVDGRRADRSAGMTARELTRFIQQYFHPAAALNLDGGGSTTMWTRKKGVVNYPTDNKRFDHYGQRRVQSHILVTAKQGSQASSAAQQ